MLDTVMLIIPSNKFAITDEKLKQDTRGFFEPPYIRLVNGYAKYPINPTKELLYKFGYMPFLTIIKRVTGINITVQLKVQFSVPKLIFNENFSEVKDEDFDLIIDTIYTKVCMLGIHVGKDILKDAQVSAIHYSKNIILTDGTTPAMYINEINKCAIKRTIDTNKIEYFNGGIALKHHTNSFEAIFYDKNEDLKQCKRSEKRAIDKHNSLQLSLLEGLNIKKPFEALRFEIRLNTTKKIIQTLSGIKASTDTSFKRLHNREIAKKILISYMKQLEELYPRQMHNHNTLEDVIYDLYLNNPKITLAKLLEASAYVSLGSNNIKTMHSMLKRYDSNQWYRIRQRHKSVNFPNYKPKIFEHIANELKVFNTVKLSDYLQQM